MTGNNICWGRRRELQSLEEDLPVASTESEVQVATHQAQHGETDSSPPHCPGAVGTQGVPSESP